MKRDEWPEFTPEETRQVAASMAEEVRFLNHATGNHAAETLHWPADVDHIVTELATMAQRLPQLFEQVTDWLYTQAGASRLVVSYGPHAGHSGAVVAEADAWLEDAQRHAAALYNALNSARQVTATIGAIPEDGDG